MILKLCKVLFMIDIGLGLEMMNRNMLGFVDEINVR
jgi:hypothetical protein